MRRLILLLVALAALWLSGAHASDGAVYATATKSTPSLNSAGLRSTARSESRCARRRSLGRVNTRSLVPIGIGVLLVAAGAFLFGRSLRPSTEHARSAAYRRGYLAGREDAFSGYDGGWAYGQPYAVVLRPGGPDITYRVAQRWQLVPGREYRACGHRVCSRAVR